MFRTIFQTFQQMDRVRKRYLGFTISIFLIFAFILASTSIRQFDRINKIHAEYSREQIITIKKQFLEDSVNNTINYVDSIKADTERLFENRISRLVTYLADHEEDRNLTHVIDYLQNENIHENLAIQIENPDGTTIYESPPQPHL